VLWIRCTFSRVSLQSGSNHKSQQYMHVRRRTTSTILCTDFPKERIWSLMSTVMSRQRDLLVHSDILKPSLGAHIHSRPFSTAKLAPFTPPATIIGFILIPVLSGSVDFTMQSDPMFWSNDVSREAVDFVWGSGFRRCALLGRLRRLIARRS
jgi:hypothetical protein